MDNITININQNDFPELQNLKPKIYKKEFYDYLILGQLMKSIINDPNFSELNKIKPEMINNYLIEIFKLGYSMKYPTNEEIDNNNLLKLCSNLSERCLVNIPTSSQKKGEIGENDLKDIITHKYPYIKYEDTHEINHCGDGILVFPNGERVMLESKKYNSYTTINQGQIDKLKNDMIRNKIYISLLISHHSKIVGINNDFDYIEFNNEHKIYVIICISNFNNNISKLELAIILLSRLINIKHNKYITSNLKILLDDLFILINQHKDKLLKNKDKIDKVIKNINEVYDDYDNIIISIEKLLIDKCDNYNKRILMYLDITDFFHDSKYKDSINNLCDLLFQYNCSLIKNKLGWIISYDNIMIGSINIVRKKPILTINDNEIKISDINSIEEVIKTNNNK
jgi:hypothetical protein